MKTSLVPALNLLAWTGLTAMVFARALGLH